MHRHFSGVFSKIQNFDRLVVQNVPFIATIYGQSLSPTRSELIAISVDGFDGGEAQLFAEALDMDIDRAGIAGADIAPCHAQKLLAGDGLVGVLRKLVQQGKFLLGHGARLAV